MAHSVRRQVSRGALCLQNYYLKCEYKYNFKNLEANYIIYLTSLKQ